MMFPKLSTSVYYSYSKLQHRSGHVRCELLGQPIRPYIKHALMYDNRISKLSNFTSFKYSSSSAAIFISQFLNKSRIGFNKYPYRDWTSFKISPPPCDGIIITFEISKEWSKSLIFSKNLYFVPILFQFNIRLYSKNVTKFNWNDK